MLFIPIIGVIIILVVISIYISQPAQERSWSATIYYSLIINTDRNTSFNISVPAALNEADLPSPIMAKLTCKGTCSWRTTATTYGTALNVVGTDNVSVGAKMVKTLKTPGPDIYVIKDKKSFFHFDMWVNTDSWEVWVWSEYTPKNAKVNITLLISIDSVHYELNQSMRCGWECAQLHAEQTVPSVQ